MTKADDLNEAEGVFTYHLLVRRQRGSESFDVSINGDAIIGFAADAMKADAEIRYSPIFPVYLTPDLPPPVPPAQLDSILFVFDRSPHKLLGNIRLTFTQEERDRVFFSQGLASVLMLNVPWNRALEILGEAPPQPREYWAIHDGQVSSDRIKVDLPPLVDLSLSEQLDLAFPEAPDARLNVYVEQIVGSLTALWASYRTYFPEELVTLRRLSLATRLLIDRYRVELARLRESTLAAETLDFGGAAATADSDVPEARTAATKAAEAKSIEALGAQSDVNAIIAAAVELSATLSYAVTQGTTGAAPILSNPAPFPHRSLLGVGSAVRALTVFTRYLESALTERSATQIVERQYPNRAISLPAKIPTYSSGNDYRLGPSGKDNEFDLGGTFKEPEHLPLLTQFSLRHGFKESKFAVTAPAESLSAETITQWTLITLSHEIMHSRVRGIFEALFGGRWDDDQRAIITDEVYTSFQLFVGRREQNANLRDSLRNVVLNFCVAMDRSDPVPHRRHSSKLEITPADLAAAYARHKRKAVELFVHFHDYYFTYARQEKMYAMSIWASWIKVAAPAARPREYLVRSLATLASGTGSAQADAFEHAATRLGDALESLEAIAVTSPLFRELRRLLAGSERQVTQSLFDLSYYLIDQVARCFASRRVAELIDCLDRDPFAEGSADAEQYGATIYVYGGDGPVSPIRFAMAGLLSSMKDDGLIKDLQWLTAWNTLVISSQEVHI